MPPTSSPSETPAFPSAEEIQYLQQLETISSPVPDLAATLFNIPTEATDADDENINFLRTRTHSPSESPDRARRTRSTFLPEVDLESMDIDEQRRFVPSPAEITPRLPSARRQQEGLSAVPSYEGGRTSHQRSLYGWAPGSEEEQGDDSYRYQTHPTQNYQSDVGSGLDRELSRNASLSRTSRRDAIVPALTPYAADSSETTNSSSRHWSDYNSTFTEALLRSVRRGARFASRTRTLQNYILDRERIGRQETDERERERNRTTSSSASRALRITLRNASGDLRDRVNTHRQSLTENPPSSRLRETIEYLEYIRHSNSFSESISSAVRSGVVQYDQLLGSYNEVDFILDTILIMPPSPSSWLHPGSTFSGSQRAVNNVGGRYLEAFVRQLSPNLLQPVEPSEAANNSETASQFNIRTSSGRRYWASTGLPVHRHEHPREPKHELWPVKVTIHSIDYSHMTLTGTMEAHNIPDKTSPTRDAHIITFLQGEIIDLNTHTLKTTNFQANSDIDCTYWRELRPFRGLSDEQMAKNLLSKRWVTDELNRNWILMRWKERCFITPTDARQGLTISGFYYISLHRETGEIEGLYYDPGSSPYQQLSLIPERQTMAFPAYDLR